MRKILSIAALLLILAEALTAREFDAAAREAGVVSADGTVKKSLQGGAWTACAVGDVLATGDRIRTEANSSASLVFTDKTVMRLGAGTTITLIDLSETPQGSLVRKLGQEGGRSWSDVTPNPSKPTTFEVRGPNAVAAVKGTSFEVDAESDETDILCWEGAVECLPEGGGQPLTIQAGSGRMNRFRAARGRPPLQERFDPDQHLDAFRQWNIQNRARQKAFFAQLPPRVKLEAVQLRNWAARNHIRLTTGQRVRLQKVINDRVKSGQRPVGRPPGPGGQPRPPVSRPPR